jgi:CrcB protein
MIKDWSDMALYSFVCVFLGAGMGACLRWWLGIALNPMFPTVPMGTLAANLLGGFLVGVAAAYFSIKSGLPTELRLLAITGFLGGLTTFSTFSSEVVTQIARGQFAWALATISVHLFGSLALTSLGMIGTRWLLLRG